MGRFWAVPYGVQNPVSNPVWQPLLTWESLYSHLDLPSFSAQSATHWIAFPPRSSRLAWAQRTALECIFISQASFCQTCQLSSAPSSDISCARLSSESAQTQEEHAFCCLARRSFLAHHLFWEEPIKSISRPGSPSRRKPGRRSLCFPLCGCSQGPSPGETKLGRLRTRKDSDGSRRSK